jgi:hypothetical protein
MAKENRPTENLRSLYYQMFLNFMNADGLMAKAIINNYKQKQQQKEKNGTVQYMVTDSTIKR